MADETNELAATLGRTRNMKGLSLRAVADPAEISATYLQKLERGDVQDPSPNILYRLAEVLGLDYAALMNMAGYVVPAGTDARRHRGRGTSALSHALSAEPLTRDEEAALSEYLGYLRSRKAGPRPRD